MRNFEPHSSEIFTRKEAKCLGIIAGASLGFVSPSAAFKKVNKQILELIEGGELFWRKPWRDGYRFKGKTYGIRNYVTGHGYVGANAWLIHFMNMQLGQNNEEFLTAKQIHARGGKLKKDAVPYPVHAFIKGEKEVKRKDGKKQIEEYVGWVDYVVYPIGHTEGVKPIVRKTNKIADVAEEIVVDAEEILAGMPKRPEIKHGGNRAFYTSAGDYVQMPFKKSFKKAQQYYGVLFHELIHSTGNKKRIGRKFGIKFGDKDYAFEELIAELGSAYLSATCNIEYHTLNNSAAYLKGWAKSVSAELKKDNKFMFRAIYGATKAAKYIIGTTLNKFGEIKRSIKTPKAKKSKTDPNQVKMNFEDLGNATDAGIVFIYRYVKLHGKQTTKKDAKQFLDQLQRAIEKQEIKKDHPYADIIMTIQEQLVKLINALPAKGSVKVEIAKGDEYTALLNNEAQGLGFLPLMIAAAAGKVVEHVVHKRLNKPSELSGVKTKRKKAKAKEIVSPKIHEVKIKKKVLRPDVAKKTIWNDTAARSMKHRISGLGGGFVSADQKAIVKSADTFQLPGELGKFIQDIQPYKYAIVITGDPHAGKTEFVTQLADAFATVGKEVGHFSLEQGGLESKDTRAAVDRNIAGENLTRIKITGEAKNGIATLKQYANKFQVIIVDSWQKLGIPATQFDSLRQQYPNTIWIIIFQQTSDGRTRGGTSANYDSPVVLKVHRVDHTFKNNYVEMIKNRGNDLGFKYMIKDKQTISLNPNTNGS